VHERKGGLGVTSIQIGTLQLEVGIETGLVLYAWGYHPHTLWRPATVAPEVVTPCAVRVVADPPFVLGVSCNIAAVGEWETLYDQKSGWLRVAADESNTELFACVAEGVLVGLNQGQIRSVWLNPIIEEP
jgi:hypothetical protein